MNDRLPDQLDKVLALADSSHEGEAVVAVRMARQILSRDGLTFADLARAAAAPNRTSLSCLLSSQVTQLENQLAFLRQHACELEDDNLNQAVQIESFRRKVSDLEQQLSASQSDANKWRQIARETIEKLWDIGQVTNAAEFCSSRGFAEIDEDESPIPKAVAG